jgi:hypothetical protein
LRKVKMPGSVGRVVGGLLRRTGVEAALAAAATARAMMAVKNCMVARVSLAERAIAACVCELRKAQGHRLVFIAGLLLGTGLTRAFSDMSRGEQVTEIFWCVV